MTEIKKKIRDRRQEMFTAQKAKDMQKFKEIKLILDRLIEQESKIRFNGQEQKFALRHTPEQIHNFIDLIGYTQKEALEITDRRIAITLESLQRGEIEPNLGNNRDHIYKIIAHKGVHSKNGAGVLKLAVSDYLERNGFEHHKDMDHGVFLVRLQAN